MKLSVVIPCYNGENTIDAQLKALSREHWVEPWEVIVSNNGSTDRSMEIVEEYTKKIENLRIVDASSRRGQPFALNVGGHAAKGEFLAFCDADDEIGQGWVRAIGNALLEHDFVACRTDSGRLNSEWLQKARGCSQRRGLQKIWYPPYLPHGGGGTIGVKKTVFEMVGGFDETLPYLHDTDFCFKVQMRGNTLHFIHDAVMHIRFRDSLTAGYTQARNYGEYNVILSKRYRTPELKAVRQWSKYLRSWVKLILYIPRMLTRNGRYKWMWQCGGRIGILRGSLKYWTPPV